jgi:hypothetical protein
MPVTTHHPLDPQRSTRAPQPPASSMADLFWSLWQSIKYPARTSNPPCVFLAHPTAASCSQYSDVADIPPKPAGHARVVFISDTHGRHSTLRVPACDVLCHCGDIMFMGGKFSPSFCESQYSEFDAWMVPPSPPPSQLSATVDCLAQAAQPAAHRIVIAGNHDQHLQVPRAAARDHAHRAASIIYSPSLFSFGRTRHTSHVTRHTSHRVCHRT